MSKSPLLARPSRRTLVPRTRVAAAAALSVAAFGLGTSTASAAVVPAAPVSEFRDSNGVQLHTNFAGLPGDTTPIGTIQEMLRRLGIWHVRDNVCLAKDSECVRPRQRLASLADSLGAGQPKVDLLLNATNELGTHPDRIQRDADIQRALLAMTTPPLAGHIAGIEETNEPDLQGIKDWSARTVSDDTAIRALLAQPQFASLSQLPLLGSSMGHPESTPALLTGGWPAGEETTPNFHPYPPAWGGPEVALNQQCTKSLTVLGCANSLGPLKPWATESGYSTVGSMTATAFVSRAAQATYLPRLLLDNFSKGVARTYLYELIDLNVDATSVNSGFGLWKAQIKNLQIVSGQAKPAATAISRLNARLGDAGAGGEAGSLDLTLQDAAGHDIPDTLLRRVLLRRADGTYALALWQPKAVWNNTPYKQHSIAVPSLSVNVAVKGWDGDLQATAFRPSLTDMAKRYTGSSFALPVGADVTLIDLRNSDDPDPIPGGAVKVAK